MHVLIRHHHILDAMDAIISVQLLQSLDDTFVSALSIIRNILNAHQPCGRFPPEILAIIFRHASNGSTLHEVAMWESSCLDIFQLVRLTHVCHRWREVALSTPSLWCSINDYTSCIPTILDRSRSMNLTLTTSADLAPGSAFHDFLHEHSSRISELHWVRHENSSAIQFSSHEHLSFGAPQLRSLTLALRHLRYPPYNFPGPTLFQGDTPQLRFLTLRKFPFIPSNNFPTLTHLHLSGLYGTDPCEALLSLFSRSPNLQEVVIEEENTSMRQFVFSKVQSRRYKVPLKHLHRFELGYIDPVTIVSWLHQLDLDPYISMLIRSRHEMDPATLGSIAALLPGNLTRVALEYFDWDTPYTDFAVTATGSSCGIRYLIKGSTPHGRQGWYGRMLSAFPQADVREFWVRVKRFSDTAPPFVVPIHGLAPATLVLFVQGAHWPNLETLVMFNCRLQQILDFLSPGYPVYPNLSMLRIVGAPGDLSVNVAVTMKFKALRARYRPINLVLEVDARRRENFGTVSADVEALFESVEYRFYHTLPTMSKPDVCRTYWTTEPTA
ncbi:hypothetical protein A0H81_05028 [Grifola frondosa]|uniref:F-box domain-containing protein n=1 Tax=Grifola frondosa TaxID=5627 RepID=A0A1C7ME25_GRIFR|nr:hypothetical protein A0H81_05028 [Grifola frondosa]